MLQSDPKVLILDDDPSITELLSDVLLQEGYKVMASNSPKDVVFLSRQFRPDVLILDVMMPELDGVEVCEFFKKDPELKFTRIVIITARDDRETRLRCFQAKADMFLPKPFEMEELCQIVRNQADSKLAHDRSIQELRNQTIQDSTSSATNRRYMERRLAEEFKRAKRQGTQLGSVLIHLDTYRNLCIYYGFAFGNEIMRNISESLRQELREFDLLSRFNEDTFLILLPDSDEQATAAVAMRARSLISGMVFLKKKSLTIFPTIVTYVMGNASGPEDILHQLQSLLDRSLSSKSAKLERGKEV